MAVFVSHGRCMRIRYVINLPRVDSIIVNSGHHSSDEWAFACRHYTEPGGLFLTFNAYRRNTIIHAVLMSYIYLCTVAGTYCII